MEGNVVGIVRTDSFFLDSLIVKHGERGNMLAREDYRGQV